MTGAALEQELNYVPGLVRLVKNGSPADEVEFMHVAESMHITTGVDKVTHDLDMGLGGCPMCWISSVAGFKRIRICAVLEQQAYYFHLSVMGCGVQSCPA